MTPAPTRVNPCFDDGCEDQPNEVLLFGSPVGILLGNSLGVYGIGKAYDGAEHGDFLDTFIGASVAGVIDTFGTVCAL